MKATPNGARVRLACVVLLAWVVPAEAAWTQDALIRIVLFPFCTETGLNVASAGTPRDVFLSCTETGTDATGGYRSWNLYRYIKLQLVRRGFEAIGPSHTEVEYNRIREVARSRLGLREPAGSWYPCPGRRED